MLMVVNEIPVSLNSEDAQRENASRAALEATYAEKRGALLSTPMEEMLMTWAVYAFDITGSVRRFNLRLPK